ncbi:MAG: hypothetical protein COX19_13410 [Desulfobacterales bacterium CG23_combo_of_CG06-09_8_20_14_all_51_8]|nr:MAG: hypothetical protein COX19_13410 [Desulfobacterales bacterium CG23_combo_of_CG06-09_8_20_14_all_51_8]
MPAIISAIAGMARSYLPGSSGNALLIYLFKVRFSRFSRQFKKILFFYRVNGRMSVFRICPAVSRHLTPETFFILSP